MRGGPSLGDGQQQPAVVPPGVEVRAGQRLGYTEHLRHHPIIRAGLFVQLHYAFVCQRDPLPFSNFNAQTILFVVLLVNIPIPSGYQF